jgi:hypothetical protein
MEKSSEHSYYYLNATFGRKGMKAIRFIFFNFYELLREKIQSKDIKFDSLTSL